MELVFAKVITFFLIGAAIAVSLLFCFMLFCRACSICTDVKVSIMQKGIEQERRRVDIALADLRRWCGNEFPIVDSIASELQRVLFGSMTYLNIDSYRDYLRARFPYAAGKKEPEVKLFVVLYQEPDSKNVELEIFEGGDSVFASQEDAYRALVASHENISAEEKEFRAETGGTEPWQYYIAEVIQPVSVSYKTNVSTTIKKG